MSGYRTKFPRRHVVRLIERINDLLDSVESTGYETEETGDPLYLIRVTGLELAELRHSLSLLHDRSEQ